MKATGIICEYNPFHTGHLHQIKSLGETAVVCLMSGNITQRGEFAITDKYTRAACALSAGADLVLELPFPYCASSAEFFAAAGVCILDSLGVDEINFGSESGNAEKLRALAELTSKKDFDEKYKKKLENDPTLGTTQAYFEVCRDFGLDGELLSNDLLAVSYFKAALRSGCESKLTITLRDGSDYTAKVTQHGLHPSATALRNMLLSGETSALELMPSGAREKFAEALKRGDAPSKVSELTAAILSFFRLADKDELSRFAEASGGLASRLCTAAKESVSLDEFFAKATSKRYTDARVRRAVINCIVGVTPEDLRATPAYTQLLAANNVGRALLAKMKKAAGIAVVTKPADAEALGVAAKRQSELSARVDSLFSLTLPQKKAAFEYIKRAPFIDFQEND